MSGALLSKTFDKPEHIFGNKVKCPACGHAMIHYTKQNPRFKCGTAKLTDHCGCANHTILQSDIEKAVIASMLLSEPTQTPYLARRK